MALQVVVDERHGVQHLHRASRGHRQLDAAADRLARGQAQARPHALAPASNEYLRSHAHVVTSQIHLCQA